MSEADHCDVLVLGCRLGGKLMAWTMAEEGKRTAVVKRKYIGHPVRTLPASRARTSFISAKVASFVGRHREVGIETGPVSVDMEGFYQRKRKMVDDLAGQPYTTLRDAVFPPSDDVGGGQLPFSNVPSA